MIRGDKDNMGRIIKQRPDNHLASSSNRRYRLVVKTNEPIRGAHNETILRN